MSEKHLMTSPSQSQILLVCHSQLQMVDRAIKPGHFHYIINKFEFKKNEVAKILDFNNSFNPALFIGPFVLLLILLLSILFTNSDQERKCENFLQQKGEEGNEDKVLCRH